MYKEEKQPDHSSREKKEKKKGSRISDYWCCTQITEPCLASISQQEIRDFLNYSVAECEKNYTPFFNTKVFLPVKYIVLLLFDN